IPDRLTGVYLINFSVGTPPKFQQVVVDTGSHINWIQCQPCVDCYKQDIPIFYPVNSSTFKPVSCQSPKCFQNNCQGSQCVYFATYVSSSYSFGDVATDTFTFYSANGEELSFPAIVFGCAHRSKSTPVTPMMSGLIGLGASPASLMSQIINPAFGQKFSYCFVPFSLLGFPSKLTFGDNAWGPGSFFTPLIVKPSDVFYFLTLLGISVGEKKLELIVNSSTIFQEGNIVIDSGTTYTSLPTPFYNQLETVVREAVEVEPWSDNSQSGTSLSLCYKDLDGNDIPPLTLHFIGADVPLSKDNIMPPMPNSDGLCCLAFLPTENQPFFGNVAQSNFLVGYDLDKMIVSFKATDCTKMA
ncbi:aspartic proteinase CDR1-like, partial [Nicotiana sylvestris]